MRPQAHQAIQQTIKKNLPQVILEKRFSTIHRIADIVYPPEKIIYEIQYSPISLKEIQKRNRDYSSLGYTVIWILHDHHFNQTILSPAELYLRKNLSYYTSITSYGHGFFYDQLEFFRGSQRVYKGAPLILDSLLPLKTAKFPLYFPRTFKEKAKRNSIYLPGDLIDRLMKTNDFVQIRALERVWSSRKTLYTFLIELFEYLLKKNAKPRE